MNLDVREISQCKRELIFTLEDLLAKKEYQKALIKYKNFVEIKGFRKGKAPLSLVQQKYGEAIKRQFMDDFAQSKYKDIVDSLEVKPVSKGEIKDVSWEQNKSLTIKYSYQVEPIIHSLEYEGLEVEHTNKKVTTKDLQDELEGIRYKFAQQKEVEDFAKDQDTVFCVMEFIKSKKTFERNFTFGNSVYGKKFDIDVQKIKKGSQIVTGIDYSKEKDGSQLKAVKVKITSIKRLFLPKIDDEFAKDAGFENMIAFKKSIKGDLKDKVEKANEISLRGAIFASIEKKNPLEVPSEYVKNYAKQMAKPYAQAYKTDISKIAGMFEKAAEMGIKESYMISFLLKKMSIKLTENEKEKFIAENAKEMKMDLQEYKKNYKESIEKDEFFERGIERKLVKKLSTSLKFVKPPKQEKIKNSKEVK